VVSEVDVGTTFTIRLPWQSDAETESAR
jgi:signal transduction histidine kinase